MEKSPAPRLVAAGKVAALFHVDPKTVNRWSVEGKIPVAFRTLGGRKLYDLNVIEPLAESLQGNGRDE